MPKRLQLKIKKPKQLQLNLNWETIDFPGPTYEKRHDKVRLKGQLLRIFNCMQDGKWRTHKQIQRWIKKEYGKYDPEPSISAQRRALRRPKFGDHTVLSRRKGDPKKGLWEYKLIVNELYTIEKGDLLLQ